MLAEFHWILPGRLAGSARPGLLAPLDQDIDHIARLGIGHVVTLTESPLDLGGRSVPFAVSHFPIIDMGLPTPRTALAVCGSAMEHIQRGDAVLFHCKAGLGRTGTMLAGCLVMAGHTAAEAVDRVRSVCPSYIQTPAQVAFLPHFENLVRAEEPACR